MQTAARAPVRRSIDSGVVAALLYSGIDLACRATGRRQSWASDRVAGYPTARTPAGAAPSGTGRPRASLAIAERRALSGARRRHECEVIAGCIGPHRRSDAAG